MACSRAFDWLVEDKSLSGGGGGDEMRLELSSGDSDGVAMRAVIVLLSPRPFFLCKLCFKVAKPGMLHFGLERIQ